MEKQTKNFFRIEEIEVEESEHFYKLKVDWFSEDPNLGMLGKYTKAIQITDIEALEKFEEEQLNKTLEEIADLTPLEDGTLEMKFKNESPYTLGLEKIVHIRGSDVVNVLDNNKFSYSCYVAKCMIVESCIQQLHQMKDQIEIGYCKWGEYPSQAGAFRSGSPYHDFLGVIETLDRFWD